MNDVMQTTACFRKQGDFIRTFIQRCTLFCTALCTVVLGAVGFLQESLPDRYAVNRGDSFSLSQSYLTSSAKRNPDSPVSVNPNSLNSQINLLGLIPVKSVTVQNVDEIELIPSGNPFGVKMFTQGAMVVGLKSIPTEDGSRCPGKEAGMEEGDLIRAINHKEISRNEEVALLIEESAGKPLTFELQRGDKTITTELTPVVSSEDGKFKSGLWVRDSAAGIGTITYIDPTSNVFAGLGHAICDIDTGEVLPVGSGEVCEVSIHSIHKGKSGTPGELMGTFASNTAIGNIVTNNETGVYGTLFDDYSAQEAYPLAHKQEVELGAATIRCSLQDEECRDYDIDIVSLDYNENNQVKNMIIRVTDEDLIDTTGGIVQGMSGTPILQNGKLIGAVTHVFVNEPLKGYAIFAENMYANSSQLNAG